MLYSKIKPIYFYSGKNYIEFPKGDTPGFNNMVFMLSPNTEDSLDTIFNPFNNFRISLYRTMYMDSHYREKIGPKRVTENKLQYYKEKFEEVKKPFTLKLAFPVNAKMIFNRKLNVITDLGHWNELFFKHRFKINVEKICRDYILFIKSKINNPLFDGYNKILYVPLDKWSEFKKSSFGVKKKNLNDPISIILSTIYYYPDLIHELDGTEILITDSNKSEVLRIPVSSLTEKSYPKVRIQLTKFSNFAYEAPEGEVLPSEKEITFTPTKLSSITKKNIDTEIEKIENQFNYSIDPEKHERVEELKQKLVNSVKHNIIGPQVEDITKKVDDIKSELHEMDELDEDVTLSNTDYNEEVENTVNDFVDNNQDLTDGTTSDEVLDDLISDEVKEKVFVPKYIPERSEETLKAIHYLQGVQNETLRLDQSFDEIKSKIIDEDDFSDAVQTNNENIKVSKFSNFDRSYAKKKYDKDIDNAVAMLSKTDHPLFVVKKEITDTSDALNLKKTYKYTLKDTKGTQHTLRFDLPILLDDQFMYIGGNKKAILKQMTLKPIVKVKPDTVELNSQYNKVFVTRSAGDSINATTVMMKKFFIANGAQFKVKPGNAYIKNRKKYRSPLDFDALAKNIVSMIIGNVQFEFDLFVMEEKLKELSPKKKIDMYDMNHFPIAYNMKTKEIYFINSSKGETIVEFLYSLLPDSDKKILGKIKPGNKFVYSVAKMATHHIPLVLYMLYCAGFDVVTKKANIKYRVIDKDEGSPDIDPMNERIFELKDKYLIWETKPVENSILMNGLQRFPFELYTYEQLEEKETYLDMMSLIFEKRNIAFELDQFKDFLIDPITEEVLKDFNLPTDLIDVFVYINRMLADNFFLPENSLYQNRIRSLEIVPNILYKAVAKSYMNYRRTIHKKNPSKVGMKPNIVIQDILKQEIVEDSSVLNPILELEQGRAVTYKGVGGINLDDAYSLEMRSFDKSMLGVIGISTTPTSKVGINRQLTLEPAISSTRGYLDVTPMEDLDKLNSANLFTPAELLSPPGVMHDDAQRTSMAYKQSKYMLLTEDSSPVLIGNKVESVVPYHLSREFVFTAKQDGKVIDYQDGVVVVQYKDGTYDSYDVNPKVQKNSSAGFYIESQYTFDKKIGDKFKKGEVLACNNKAFTKNKNDRSASMNIGVLSKIAIVPNYDEYEDSTPITKSLSERLSAEMVDDKAVALHRLATVGRMVKIGDKINARDPLIVFDNTIQDPEVAKYLNSLNEKEKQTIIESSMTTIKSNFAGEVVDIKIYSTVDIEELSLSLQEIVNENYKRIKAKNDLLEKYKNPDDTTYYKCGQLITEDVVKIIPVNGKVKGKAIEDGVVIHFYIKYRDIVKKGDKVTQYTALKGTISHVIEEGLEPYSEYRKDEEVSLLMAPGAILARKTPSVILTMFGNKVLIELKRKLKEDYLND